MLLHERQVNRIEFDIVFGVKHKRHVFMVLCRYEVAPRSDSEDSGSEEEEEEEEVQNTFIS